MEKPALLALTVCRGIVQMVFVATQLAMVGRVIDVTSQVALAHV